MKSFLNKNLNRVQDNYTRLMVAATLTVMLMPSSAFAQSAQGEVKDLLARSGGQFAAAGPIIQTVFAFLGFFLVGAGIWGLATRKDNPQKPISHSLWAIVGGSFLLILVVVLRVVTQSTFGASSSATFDRIGID